jgi:hypothetical protein
VKEIKIQLVIYKSKKPNKNTKKIKLRWFIIVLMPPIYFIYNIWRDKIALFFHL